MQIWQLDSSHAEAYRALRLEALRESPTAFNSSYEEEKEQPLATFQALLSSSPSRTLFGVFEASKMVASVSVGRESRLKVRHKGSINAMFVAPSCRGQGLAKQLLSCALKFADAQEGLMQLSLIVNANNLSAISLYKMYGFKPFGIEPKAALIEGIFYDEMHMVRLNPGLDEAKP